MRGVQPGAHFEREHLVPQALRLADFVLVPGPGNRNRAATWSRDVLRRSVKRPPGRDTGDRGSVGMGSSFMAGSVMAMA